MGKFTFTAFGYCSCIQAWKIAILVFNKMSLIPKCPQNSLWAHCQAADLSGTASLLSEDFERGFADKKYFD